MTLDASKYLSGKAANFIFAAGPTSPKGTPLQHDSYGGQDVLLQVWFGTVFFYFMVKCGSVHGTVYGTVRQVLPICMPRALASTSLIH